VDLPGGERLKLGGVHHDRPGGARADRGANRAEEVGQVEAGG
jgi:hypothetical protein